MRLAALLLVGAVAPLSAQVRGVELYQLLGKEIPVKTTGTTRLQWLPGGGYLESGPDSVRGGRAFFRVDPGTGKRTPLFDEKTVNRITSEYTRLSGKETKGLPFTLFTWESNNTAIGFTAGGDRYAWQLASGTLLKLATPAKTGPFDMGQNGAAGAFSPDFKRFAFVRDYDNLWIYDVASGQEELIGKGTSEDNTLGFLNAGQWFTWSPDGRRIAYLKASQSGTKTPVFHGLSQPSNVTWFRYPYTTDSTARMEVWVADLDSKQQVKVTTSTVENPWIRELTWLPGGKEVAWQVLGQWQDRLELDAGDAVTGANRQLMLDRDTAFMTDEHSFRLLADGKRFLWSSERTGWRHIYLYDHVTGKLIKPLTSGDWEVEEVEGIDEPGGWVYFTAAGNLGLEQSRPRPEPLPRQARRYRAQQDHHRGWRACHLDGRHRALVRG
jgi:dipeptidyl-peptidase-4